MLAVLGTPNAFHAQIMEAAGCEAAFVGTGITGGNYTAFPDTGVLSAAECVQFGGYIARAVSFPVILDGDTGHGGAPAVRRLVHDCIRAGLAGIRIDDQPIEGKRATQTPGIEVVSRDAAVDRYRAAVRARDELDPDFVIMAQCYARDAVNGGMHELVERLNAYWTLGGVDWVQFESPHSIDEIRQARRGDRHALRHAGQARPAADPRRAFRARAAHRVVHVPARPGPQGDELGVLARLQGT